MKRLLYILAVIVVSNTVFAQTNTENYVLTTTYQVEFDGGYEDYYKNIGPQHLFYGYNQASNPVQVQGYVSILNNILTFELQGYWDPNEFRLKTGSITQIEALQDSNTTIELGELQDQSGATGYFAKIINGTLYFNTISQQLDAEIDTSITATFISQNPPMQYGSNNLVYEECFLGVSSNGNGYISVEDDVITLILQSQLAQGCYIKLGQIHYLDTQYQIPDTELGYLMNAYGEQTEYKAKIENNWLVFYSNTITIPNEIQHYNSQSLIDITEDDMIKIISYYDGLGRVKQSVTKQSGGNRQDIVTPIIYDNIGRQVKDFLPYANPTQTISSSTLNYRPQENISTGLINDLSNAYLSKYPDDFNGVDIINAYSEKVYEASPLNRILEQAAPGSDWAKGNNHTIKFNYQTNSITDGVKQFSVNHPNNDKSNIELIYVGNYLQNKLYKTITKDENWQSDQQHTKNHTIEEFKNKEGQLLLKRTYNNDDNNPYDTYYVYDDYSNLTYVLSPEGSQAIETASNIINQSTLDDLCFQYKYDYRNRLIEKKLPGKGWEYFIYNKRDQRILTQDANLRTSKKWLFTKYDVFGRVAYTGLYINPSNISDAHVRFKNLQTLVDGEIYLYETRNNSTIDNEVINWSNTAFPTTINILHTVSYYDDYNFNFAGTTPIAIYNTIDINTKDLTTGSMVRVLDVSPAKWIKSTQYYDDEARLIYSKTINEYLDTEDIIESELDFIGKTIKKRSYHKKGTNNEIVTIDNFTYDHAGRLLTQTQCIGDNTLTICIDNESSIEPNIIFSDQMSLSANEEHSASNSITLIPGFTGAAGANTSVNFQIQETVDNNLELIVNNTYDELGQLESKKVGGAVALIPENSNGLQTVDYTYNIRGWLKQINDPSDLADDLFTFRIGYNEGPNALYNGNIALAEWKTKNVDQNLKTYNYTYDALNRIVTGIDNTGRYNLNTISYDKNGNIITLNRSGHLVENPNANTATHFGVMDNLTYTYNGNKLINVTDNANEEFGFKDGNVNSTTNIDDYSYDANGNMLIDNNKGITQNIIYNHLNLPKHISINTNNIFYVYDATGIKQAKVVNNAGSMTTTKYAGNYIYEEINTGEELKFFSHPEGYAQPKNTGGFNYVYQFKDHLENIRLAYSDINDNGVIEHNTEILEENNYYPFGLKHKGYNNNYTAMGDHSYGFGGKEEQDELGLGWIDITARNYNPALGRWMNIDPLAEQMRKHSPYNYAFNNPIFFIDPDGMKPYANQGGNNTDYNKGFGRIENGIRQIFDGVIKHINSELDIEREKKIASAQLEEAYYAQLEKEMDQREALMEISDGVMKVAKGTVYAAADGADELAGKVSEGATYATVVSGGLLAPITVPLGKAADAVSLGAKGVKAVVNITDGDYRGAASEAFDGTKQIILGKAVGKFVKQIKINAKLTEVEEQIHEAIFSLNVSWGNQIFNIIQQKQN